MPRRPTQQATEGMMRGGFSGRKQEVGGREHTKVVSSFPPRRRGPREGLGWCFPSHLLGGRGQGLHFRRGAPQRSLRLGAVRMGKGARAPSP